MFGGGDNFGTLIGIAKGLRERESDADREIQRLRQLVANLQLELAIEKAHSGGLTAYLDAIKATSPSIPALKPSGKVIKDGRVKTVGRLAYEEAFDRIGRDLRIPDPVKHRAN